MEETRIDMRLQTPEQIAEGQIAAQLCFRLGQMMPYPPQYNAIVVGNPAKVIRMIEQQ